MHGLLDVEIGLGVETEQTCDDVRGYRLGSLVVGPHIVVLEAPSGLDPILGRDELVLEVEEARARFEVRIVLRHGEKTL